MNRKLVFWVSLICLPLLLASKPEQQTRTKKKLAVPLLVQETRKWCWAASLQMILAFHGEEKQCKQANARANRQDCCEEETPRRCVRGGWPQFNDYMFESQKTDSSIAITWDELKNEIDSERPVAFSWAWKKGSGHMMVAIGYADPHWVYVNDPFPPDASIRKGEFRIIKYNKFVESSKHAHWIDYFSISREVPVITNLPTPPPAPEPGPAEPVDEPTIPAAQVVSTEPIVTPQPQPPAPAAEGVAPIPPRPAAGLTAITQAVNQAAAVHSTLSGMQGTVDVKVTVDKNGAVTKTEVVRSSGNRTLDGAVVDAVESVEWQPGRQGNVPIISSTTLPITVNIP